MFFVLLPLIGQAADTSTTAQIDYCAAEILGVAASPPVSCDWRPRGALSVRENLKPTKWVRIRFDTLSPGAPETMAIQVAPHFIPLITLYGSADGGKNWATQVAGIHHTGANPYDVIGGYLFVVTPTPRSPVFYLQISGYTAGQPSILVEPWPAQGLLTQTGLGLHLGILMLIFFYALASYVLEPRMLMLRFSVFMGVVVLSMLSGSGILAKYAFVDAPRLDNTVFALLVSARLGAWVWLSEAFLLPYSAPRWYKAVCWVMYVVFCVCALLSLMQATSAMPILVVSSAVIFALAQLIATIRTPDIDSSQRKILLTGFLLILASILAMTFSTVFYMGIEQLPLIMSRISDLGPVIILACIIVTRNQHVLHQLEIMRQELLSLNLRTEFEQKLHHERRMMLDMLTHELKNPLASISFATGSLAQQIDISHEEKERRVRNIERSIQNMDAVIERCSTVNTLDESDLQLDCKPVLIKPLLTEIIEALNSEERFLLQAPDRLIIHTDRNLLRMIFSNLIDNASKYSIARSVINISARIANNSHALISFSNAIDPEILPDSASIFTRFYRHNAAHHISGTGLGLYLVHELCKRLGGTITYTSTENAVTFEVKLPL